MTPPHEHDAASASTVRPARTSDAAEVAAITLASWTGPYSAVLPDGALDGVSVDDLAAEWTTTLADLPTPRHLVLVALDGTRVTGYAVLAPSTDPDVSGADDLAEVVDLVVHPGHHRRGHGSRLLAAAVDVERAAGVVELTTWVVVADEPRAEFLRAAGFAPDGAERTLDTGPGTRAAAQARWSARL